LLRSAEGKPSFASISPMGSPVRLETCRGLVAFDDVVSGRAVQGSRVGLGRILSIEVWLAASPCWSGCRVSWLDLVDPRDRSGDVL
jgi:hypothetical protein